MRLAERVTFQRATAAADSFGGQTTTWATTHELWAEVRAVRGRELEVQGRQATVETYLIRVRFGPEIVPTDRLVWNGKTMNIRSAQDREGLRRFLTIEAEVGFGP